MSDHTFPESGSARRLDRRTFLALAGLAGGAAGTAYLSSGRLIGDVSGGEAATVDDAGASPGAIPDRATSARFGPGIGGDRALVVIELAGGNDGLNTLAPVGIGAYHDHRPGLALGDEEVIGLDGDHGLHPSLSRLAERGLAVVAGVGTRDADGSHFEMSRRWWGGDSDGRDVPNSGVLGRCCDVLSGADAGIAGIAIGNGPTPIIQSERGTSLGLPSAQALASVRGGDPVGEAIRTGLRQMTEGTRPELAVARQGLGTALDVVDALAELPEPVVDFPGTSLGRDLAEASRILRADVGIRLVHVRHGGFDTHDDQNGRHAGLLAQYDEAVDALLREVADIGMADSVVVATISEFGRRPRQNSSGTDHGTASVALLSGAVNHGVFGAHPSLTDLDDGGNLVATVDMESYYATLLEGWLEVPAGEVIGAAVDPLDGLFRT